MVDRELEMSVPLFQPSHLSDLNLRKPNKLPKNIVSVDEREDVMEETRGGKSKGAPEFCMEADEGLWPEKGEGLRDALGNLQCEGSWPSEPLPVGRAASLNWGRQFGVRRVSPLTARALRGAPLLSFWARPSPGSDPSPRTMSPEDPCPAPAPPAAASSRDCRVGSPNSIPHATRGLPPRPERVPPPTLTAGLHAASGTRTSAPHSRAPPPPPPRAGARRPHPPRPRTPPSRRRPCSYGPDCAGRGRPAPQLRTSRLAAAPPPAAQLIGLRARGRGCRRWTGRLLARWAPTVTD